MSVWHVLVILITLALMALPVLFLRWLYRRGKDAGRREAMRAREREKSGGR